MQTEEIGVQRQGGLMYGVVSVLVAGALSVMFGGVAQAQQWQMVYNEEFTTPKNTHLQSMI